MPAPRIRQTGFSEAQWSAFLSTQPLPFLDLGQLFGERRRLVVAAPHPDDEVLASGGLIALALAQNVPVVLIAVTDGEHSHPHSSVHTPAALRAIRPAETAAALKALGEPPVEIHRLGIEDGKVDRDRTKLLRGLEALCTADDLLVSTWRHDGHPDHESVAEAAAQTARSTGCMLLEAPVWAWNWNRPDDHRLPLHDMLAVNLPAPVQQRKAAAIACFRSQIAAPPDGGEPILSAETLAYFRRPFELYLSGREAP